VASINKRKILESAQRNLQKGALDKALKDYQSILEVDPRDSNVRLKLGDLQLRRGNNDDAISAYLKVADQFMRDGFDAKAVALYKQVTKIDSKRHDIYVPLADLYQRLGLVSEAMVALQTAADAHHREGRKREALDLLRRMASLDPANVTSRLKVAELLRQEGLQEEAVAEFSEAAAELERQGDWEGRINVLERIVELRPDRVDALETLASTWLDRREPRRAHAFAQKLVEADAARPESQELLARVLAALGQEELAVDAYRQCAEAWRVRGDEDRAREIVQRHLPTQSFDAGVEGAPAGVAAPAARGGEAIELGVTDENLTFEHPGDQGAPEFELGEAGLSGEEGLDEAAFEASQIAASSTTMSPPATPALEPPPAAAPPPAPAPLPEARAPAAARAPAPAPAPVEQAEGDPEQLLAEATVYLRYGKHERALASLRGVLAQVSEHVGALEQLGEVHAAMGASEEAVDAWCRAARAASAAGDAPRFEQLRERVEAVDALAAADLVPPETAGGEDAAPDSEVPDLDAPDLEAPDLEASERAAAASDLDEIEIDVDDEALLETGAGAAAAAAPAGAGVAPADGAGIDIEIDTGAGNAPETGAAAGAEAAGPGDALELSFDDTEEASAEAAEPTPAPVAAEPPSRDERAAPAPRHRLEITEPEAEARPESWELPAEDEQTPAPPAAAASPPAGELSQSSAQAIQEELEEAGFYFEQGLLDEAEALYRRVLVRAPSHPGALLRLGEISVQRGGQPGDSLRGLRAPVSDATERGPASWPPPSRERAAEATDVEPPDALDLTEPTLEEQAAAAAGWSREAAADSEAEDSTAGVSAAPAPPPRSRPAARAPAPEEPELTAPDMPREDVAGGPAFDLAAELSEAFSGDSSPGTRAGTDEDGFESLFREFKRGVSQTLGEGDVETHFDLGIAYREMGLYEDAIGEFRYALGMPARRLDALHMMGLCALDLGRTQDAVGHLEQALASPEVPPTREVALRFDLGHAYEAASDPARALDAYRRVVELDASFQDAAERVGALERGESPSKPPEDSDEAYESFDDLVAEAADGDEAAEGNEGEESGPVERYESFEDVVADGDADTGSGDDAGEGVGAGRPTPAAAVEAETEAAFAEATLEEEAGPPQPLPATQRSEPEPEAPAREPGDSGRSSQRRRRKVSFV
jgi:pilus assembly protein FimV